VNKLVVILLLFIVLPAIALAQDIESFTTSALKSHVRTSNLTAIETAIDRAKENVRERSLSTPNERYMATIVVDRALSISEFKNFVDGEKLEVVRIEIKVPLANGAAWTISVGSMDLLSSNGSVEERLIRSIGRIRLDFLEMSRQLTGSDAEKYADLAHADMDIIKFDVVGASKNINRTLNDSRVVAIFPEESNKFATDFEYLKSMYRQKNPNANWSRSN